MDGNSAGNVEMDPGEGGQSKPAVAVTMAPQVQAKDFSQSPPGVGPGFVDIDGEVGGSGHNETEVDIIAVGCPGADPVQTWTYDSESDCGRSVRSAVGSRGSAWRPGPWITRDLRSVVSIARVFLYKHRDLKEGVNLRTLSEDLLAQVHQQRGGTVSPPLLPSARALLIAPAAIPATVFHRP